MLSMVDGKQPKMLAHRFAWEMVNGPIPEGLTIDHVRERGCRSKLCVEVAHLEPVTRGDNVRRHTATITHCPRNHPYEGDNLVWKKTRTGWQRVCRTCRNLKKREAREAKKEDS